MTVKANDGSPAGEWLLDNFYLIEEQISHGQATSAEGYSRNCRPGSRPIGRLSARVRHRTGRRSARDGRLDRTLSTFRSCLPERHRLNLGELWAIPIMLRLALIENLRRVAAWIAAGTADRDLADSWADQMMAIADKDRKA